MTSDLVSEMLFRSKRQLSGSCVCVCDSTDLVLPCGGSVGAPRPFDPVLFVYHFELAAESVEHLRERLSVLFACHSVNRLWLLIDWLPADRLSIN